MLRKLAIAIAASGAMMSAVNVHALGMGDIELESALNQPLDARIKLLKAGELENWEMKPNLASTDEFEKSGVEYVFFLNDLKFEIEREGSDVYVHVTSNKAVVEPFLNFLVQVDWPNGRLLREYTLLLDPPVFTEEVAEPVQPVESETDYYEPQQEPQSLPGVSPVAPSNQQVQSEPEKLVEPKTTEVQKPKDETYKVRPNDTLWEVAVKTRPNRNISPQQAMLAIQDLNPDAFIAGNINRLKKNQVLRVPTEDQMLSRSFDEAVSEVAIQNQAMAKRKAQLDATRKDAAIQRDDKVEGARLKLLAGGEATTENERGASGQVATKTAGDQSRLEKELSITLENLDKATRENQELRTRLDSLEDQINTLQRLINLKDEQMVALQSGMASKVEQKQAEPEPEVKAEAPKSNVGEDLNFTSADTKPNKAAEEPKTEAEKTAEKPKPVEKPKPKPLPVQQPVEEPFDPVAFVLENPPVIGAGLGALLLALIGLNVARKRKEKQQDESTEEVTQSNLTEDLTDVDLGDQLDTEIEGLDDVDDTDIDLDSESSLNAGETSLETQEPEMSPEDVMGEVDVYLAYNRLEPARDLLEKSLASNPSRQEYRTKLIEILTELGDTEAADEQRQFISGEGDLGEDLSMESQAIEDVNEDFSMDFDLDSTDESLLDEANLDSNDQLLEESDDLSFDLDGLELDTDVSNEGLEDELSLDSDDFSLDFESDSNEETLEDLSDLDLDMPKESKDSSSDNADTEASSTDNDLEFDLGDFGTEGTPEATDSEADFDFESLDLDDASEESLELASDELMDSEDDGLAELDALSIDTESSDLDFDLDEPSEPDDALDLDLSSDDLEELPELTEADTSSDLDDLSFDLDDETDNSEEDDISFDLDTTEQAQDAELSLDDLDSDLSDLESELSLDDGDNQDVEIELDSSDSDDSGLPEFEESLSLDEDIELPELTEEVGGEDSALDELDANDIDLPTLEIDSSDAELPDLDEDFDISISNETEESSVSELESTEAVAAEYKEELPTLGESDGSDDDFPPLGDIDDLDLENLDNDLDFLSGTDESETKLDLARAYIDMEDQEGAREILQEVLEEGSDQQKEEANKLLDSLA